MSTPTHHPVTLRLETAAGTQEIRIAGADLRKPISDVLRRQGIPLNTRCGQRGLCDGCLVELVAGSLTKLTGEHETATGSQEQPVTLRGCEYAAAGSTPIALRVPDRSLLAYEPQVVSDFKLNIPRAHDPLWKAGQACTLSDGTPYPRRQVQRPLGVAIDIGTTTVAVLLVDLFDGSVRAKASAFNRQMHLADDVLSRINLCMTDATMLATMQKEVAQLTIAPLIKKALHEAQAHDEQVVCITAAANTTMLHLLAGVDPTSMGIAPFTPSFLDHRILDARKVGLPYDAQLHLLPGAAAYVGADLTAGAVASGWLYDEGPSILLDIGTNGEILLKHRDRMLGCATAAGPAFEGGGLLSGVRAGRGAVAHIDFHQAADAQLELVLDVIGAESHAKPAGVCGSAYIDYLAVCRRVGILSPTGRFTDDAAARLNGHLAQNEHGKALRLAYDAGKRSVLISETDTAKLLQAKAAIAAGVRILLKQVGLTAADVKTLYLAGGFGMHLKLDSAFGSGLLPGLRHDQVQLVGNTSLAGAYLALTDRSTIDAMAHVRDHMDIIELNLDPDFEMTYIDELSLP
jgi:uncharacterized 2Fe-2S/4Fe-4S cluster protein (DUF4445 family)